MVLHATPIDGTTLALSNGVRLQVSDALTGDLVAPSIVIADDRRFARIAEPISCAEGIVVLGHKNGRPHLLMVDIAGHLRWQQSDLGIPDYDFSSLSAPVVSDRTLYVASTEFENGTRTTYLNAFDTRSGERLWRRLMASISEGEQARWAIRNNPSNPPLLLVHQGTIYMCSHNGYVMAIDPEGFPTALWPYQRSSRQNP